MYMSIKCLYTYYGFRVIYEKKKIHTMGLGLYMYCTGMHMLTYYGFRVIYVLYRDAYVYVPKP